MKTIWGLLITISFAVILFGGVSIINNDILAKNSNLNQDSIDLIATYDNNVNNITSLSGEQYRVNTQLSSNTTNQVEAFFREAAENKNNINKARDGIQFVWQLPSIIVLSLPFINVQSNGFLNLVNGIIYFMISILILLVLYKGVRTGKVDEES